MLDALAYFDFPDLYQPRSLLDDIDALQPDDDPAQYSLIEAADGWVVVSPASRAQMDRACAACGRPEWAEELRAVRDYRLLAPAFFARLQSVLPTRSVEYWVDLFACHDVPAAPVLDPDSHLVHPQIVHNELYGVVDQPGMGPVRFCRYPALFSGERTFPPGDPPAPAPKLDSMA